LVDSVVLDALAVIIVDLRLINSVFWIVVVVDRDLFEWTNIPSIYVT